MVARNTYNMRVKLGVLRNIIKEEVDRAVRNSAGMIGGGNTGTSVSVDPPPWGLGTPDELDYENEKINGEKEQETKGPALRAAERRTH